MHRPSPWHTLHQWTCHLNLVMSPVVNIWHHFVRPCCYLSCLLVLVPTSHLFLGTAYTSCNIIYFVAFPSTAALLLIVIILALHILRGNLRTCCSPPYSLASHILLSTLHSPLALQLSAPLALLSLHLLPSTQHEVITCQCSPSF